MIQFNNIILHNFGSYHHAEIDLQNKGFCLVSGENNFKQDNALSNGSGKSFIWSGICYAITGATIQGLKSDLKNIYVDENDAYVILNFIYDKDTYTIKRIIAPHSDLKIEKNNVDVSGKGIRESEAVLANLLPDLTQDLIASTIIIGQGMPNKFSAFKPSGRKDLLEKLTKSDFMIADIKARIEARKNTLEAQIRAADDKALVLKTKLSGIETTLKVAETKKATAVKPDFETLLKTANNKLSSINEDIKKTTSEIKTQEGIVDKLGEDLLAATTAKANERTALLESYNKATGEKRTTKAGLEAELRIAECDLRKIKSHPDVCPTCGQKLPNTDHIKAEKEAKEKLIKELNEKLTAVKKELTEADNKKAVYTNEINEKHDGIINSLNIKNIAAKAELNRLKDNLNDYSHYADLAKDEVRDITSKQASWDKDQADLEKAITDLTKEAKELKKELTELGKSQVELNEHLAVVKQLETLTKRDFRGYILSDIIKYLDKRAKDFAEIVFGHRNLNIYLDGNDLDISYSGKMFDNLSGGEKTRVDLITQFAIRDLLTTYLNASSNIIVLDEITDFLDATSCDAVMNLIEKELKSVESVFIISHHAEELNIPVDSELKVIKGVDGISTVC